MWWSSGRLWPRSGLYLGCIWSRLLSIYFRYLAFFLLLLDPSWYLNSFVFKVLHLFTCPTLIPTHLSLNHFLLTLASVELITAINNDSDTANLNSSELCPKQSFQSVTLCLEHRTYKKRETRFDWYPAMYIFREHLTHTVLICSS